MSDRTSGPFVIEDTFPAQEASAANSFHGYDSEDGGAHLIAGLDQEGVPLYVDVKSSTEDGGTHAAFLALRGKRVRITIQVVGSSEAKRRMGRGPQPAFGLFDYTMVPKIRRLLKLFGLDLKVKTDRRNWGDQVEVTVVEAKPK